MTFLSTIVSSPISVPTAQSPSFLLRIWPTAFVAFTLALTVAWWALLGYGLIKLIS
jgi:polyferredoxin